MSRSDRILVATAGAAVVMAAAAVVILLAPLPGASAGSADAGLLLGTPAAAGVPGGQADHGGVAAPTAGSSPAGTIFVDVEGAVAEPGIRELPAGSRVADAIAAAGGYASDADLDAAANVLNLAQPLSDGEQVQVPRLGAAPPAPAGPASPAPAMAGDGSTSGSGSGTAGGGLVDLNSASPEELEALPGIGPVTVQKIVAARQERPFTSLQDALDRGVIHRGQLEDIQGLATAG